MHVLGMCGLLTSVLLLELLRLRIIANHQTNCQVAGVSAVVCEALNETHNLSEMSTVSRHDDEVRSGYATRSRPR